MEKRSWDDTESDLDGCFQMALGLELCSLLQAVSIIVFTVDIMFLSSFAVVSLYMVFTGMSNLFGKLQSARRFTNLHFGQVQCLHHRLIWH